MNINNIQTGNVNIPGPLHSTASDSQDQIGNVVAYAGDIYDTTLGKNQSQINQEFSSSSSPEYIAYSTGQGYSIGNTTTASGENSFAEGSKTKASGVGSHAEGSQTKASGPYSHAEGSHTTPSGYCAHAEGYWTIASGDYSHAEGSGYLGYIKTKRAYTAYSDTIYVSKNIKKNAALVLSDFSEYAIVQDCVIDTVNNDYQVTLSKYFSTDLAAEKSIFYIYTVASGPCSHAEGAYTIASGDYSHAEGEGTETTNTAEHASGKYNQSTSSVTLFSVGIGADAEHRTNAFEVTTDGKMYIKDVGEYDGKSIANVDSLQTVITDVNTGLAALTTKLNAFGRAGTMCSEQLLALGNSYAFDYTNPYGFYDHGWVPSKNVNGVAIGNSVSSIGSCSFATGLGSTGGNVTSHFYELAQAYTSGDTYIYLKEKPIGEFILAKNNSYDAPVTEDICKIQSVEYENNEWKVLLVYPYINKDIAANGYVYPVTGTHGDYSSCFGSYTVAQGKNSTVVGTCNYPSASDIFSVGVGSGLNAVSRSNAVLVTQSGDVYIKGIGNYDGGDYTSAGVKSIQTVISELQAALI